MATTMKKLGLLAPALALAVGLVQVGCPPGLPTVVAVIPASEDILIGETLELSVTSTNPNDSFTWSSDNTEVATVNSDGVVEGVGVGTAVITATGTESGSEGTATVTVSAVENQALVERFRELELRIAETPADTLDDNTQAALMDSVVQGRTAVAGGNLCSGAQALNAYLPAVQSVRPGASATALGDLEVLYALGRTLQYDTALEAEQTCAGVPEPNVPAETEVEASNTDGLTAQTRFGAPRFWTVANDAGEIFTEIEVPGIPLQSGASGTPAIPAKQELVAVPVNAEVAMEGQAVVRESVQINPYPYQPQPRDQERPLADQPEPEFFGDAAFARNSDIYDGAEVWPPSVMESTSLGTFRGLQLMQVTIYGGEYDPEAGALRLFDRVDYSLNFEGGEDSFRSESFTHVFESRPSVYVDAVINTEAVRTAPPLDEDIVELLGEEFIILTHPDFRDAADRLAGWKNDKGIVTRVFEGGTNSEVDGRETAEEIDAFLESRFNNSVIKPSYVLLLGDAEFIATFYRDFIYGTVGTDYPYAVDGLLEDSDPNPQLVPDFAMGRIPVDTLAQANTVVDKIINYEQNPPALSGNETFYTSVSLAAQFQCCRSGTGNDGQSQRTYTEVAEFVRPPIRDDGYLAERIYLNTGSETPEYYYDGTALPADIGPGSSFTFDGSTQDILDAYNDGRFLFLHRDHGWVDGWINPEFDTENVRNDLSNGERLPVVFSINCSSGVFDNETNGGAEDTTESGVYWAEEMLRHDNGGAVGLICDTRVSPSWPNTALTRGLFDAIWPETVSDYGGDTRLRRLGDILNHGKLYVGTQVGVEMFTDQNDYESELKLFHVFGDPTLEMWTRDPFVVNLASEFPIVEQQVDQLTVSYETEGAMITATQRVNGTVQPIGRAPVVNGQAEIEYFTTPTVGVPIQFAATMENAVTARGSEPFPEVIQ